MLAYKGIRKKEKKEEEEGKKEKYCGMIYATLDAVVVEVGSHVTSWVPVDRHQIRCWHSYVPASADNQDMCFVGIIAVQLSRYWLWPDHLLRGKCLLPSNP